MNEIVNYDSVKKIVLENESRDFEADLNKNYGNQNEAIKEILGNYVDLNNLPFAPVFSDEGARNNIEKRLNKLSYAKQIKILGEAAKNDSYTLGYLLLHQIKSKFKADRKSASLFIFWTEIALQNRNDRYLLPEDERETINDIIEKCIASKKFDLTKFNDVAGLIQKSGAENMLSAYKSLIQKAGNEYNAQKTKIYSKYKKDTARRDSEIEQLEQTFTKRFEVCVDGLIKFIDSQIRNDSYTWYLEMPINNLDNFFDEANRYYDVLQAAQKKVDVLLVKILSYYIKTSRNLIQKGVSINDVESKWNLDQLFNLVGIKTSNQNLKLMIFQQYLNNAAQTDYLPLKLIEDSLCDKSKTASDAARQIIIDNLKNYRYIKTSNNEKILIENIIKDAILNSPSEQTQNYAMKAFENEVVLNDNYNSIMINYSDLDLSIRWELFKDNVQNKKNDKEKSDFFAKIKIFQFGYKNQSTDKDFLIKVSYEVFMNNMPLPEENKFGLGLCFLQSGSDYNHEYGPIYDNCLDFIAKNKVSESYPKISNQLAGLINSNSLPPQVSAYARAKMLP